MLNALEPHYGIRAPLWLWLVKCLTPQGHISLQHEANISQPMFYYCVVNFHHFAGEKRSSNMYKGLNLETNDLNPPYFKKIKIKLILH